eukprot:2756902-Alexandrium_andersonii.AAC.1
MRAATEFANEATQQAAVAKAVAEAAEAAFWEGEERRVARYQERAAAEEDEANASWEAFHAEAVAKAKADWEQQHAAAVEARRAAEDAEDDALFDAQA